MQKSRDNLGHPRHVPSFPSFIQVLPKSGILQRIAVPLEDVHILADPLLNEDCQECCQKAKGEGHEPENIYTDVRCRRIGHRERRRWSRRNRNLWGNRGYLYGDLREDGRVLSEVIDSFVCMVRL
jgi:hypothetical protein